MAEALGLAVNCLTVIDLTVKVASKLYDYGKDVANARDDINRLHDKVLGLQQISLSVQALLDRQGDARNIPTIDLLRQGIFGTEEKLQQLHDALDIRGARQPMRMLGFRSLKWPFKSQDVEKIHSDLQGCFEMLSQSLQVDQTSLLLDIDRRSILDRIPHAPDAAYNSRVEDQNPTCHPETRSGILFDIHKWIDDPHAKSIFWLNGMAGTGKSTISRTVARSLAQRGSLAASFFFKRGESNRGDSALFFSTLAFQLVSSVPGYGQVLKEILDENPRLMNKSLQDQFNQLLVEPLSLASKHTQNTAPFILVVDALDECGDDNDIRMIIHLLSSTDVSSNGSWRVRTFLTSRPELPIRLGFGAVRGTFQDLILHDIPSYIIERDISVFLRYELENIRFNYNLTVPQHRQLPLDWPGEASIEHITDMASPLFIAAATVCRFISDRRIGSPEEQLAKIVNSSGNEVSKLEGIYLPILRQTLVGLSVAEHEIALSDFRSILGTIAIAYTPLSARGLANILQLPERKVESRLDLLHSCLNVPSEPELPVRILHLSFRDFLVDPSRKDQSIFWINQQVTHFQIAERCLDIMDRLLQRDICGTGRNESRADLNDFQKERMVPNELEYSCLYWVDHLIEAREPLRDEHPVHCFLRTHLLHWIEAYCILANTSSLLSMIQGLIDLVESPDAEAIKSFLEDTFRIVSTNLSMIRKYPLQVYSSMLLFAPTNSIIRNTFASDMPGCVSIKTKLNSDWDPLLMTFEYEWKSGKIQMLSWSHDNAFLAAIFPWGRIQVWDVMSGQEHLSVYTHGKTRLEFSHTSEFLAASGETEIELFRRATGEAVQTIGNFGCWGFAKDAPLLATTSEDGDIILWKVVLSAHGSPFLPLKVLSASKITVSWMNVYEEGLTVASTYQDHQVTLWRFTADANVPNGDSTQPTCLGSISSPKSFFRNKYAKVMLSPNSQLIAFITPGSLLAYKVEICCATNGTLLQTFESDDAIQSTIIFSSDSQFIARDSGKGTVEVRPRAGGTSIMSLSHRGATSAAFSHDSNKLAVAWRGSVQISSISQARLTKRTQIERRLKPINCIELSPDSSVLAIGTSDEEIELWDTSTGVHRQTLRVKSSTYRFLAFSPDSQMLACWDEQEIKVWKVDTGECMMQSRVGLGLVRGTVIYHQQWRLNLVPGFPSLDPESPFPDDIYHEFGIRHLSTFQNYGLLFGNLEYVADTKDLMIYLGTKSGTWKAIVLRHSDGRWIRRGHQLETREPHTAKIRARFYSTLSYLYLENLEVPYQTYKR
ncbi:unnamed protein product [Clonostachys byssicola]|uniref:NACHT domain-containing protein n=1 Tax=Clonostachys byssicola TaxID=160290 RepID=A0A9N9U092_9HYPO|nr:unnamed protein product [Clonostachys byssicola]